jgi:hypothetical protein
MSMNYRRVGKVMPSTQPSARAIGVIGVGPSNVATGSQAVLLVAATRLRQSTAVATRR